MNDNEFARWLDHHKGAYPGLGIWIKTNPDQFDHWRRILGQVEYFHAMSATDSMVAGDDQPKGYGEHPRWLRRIATAASGSNVETYERRQEGPQVVDDRLVAECWRCMDYGIISVLSPACLRRVWNDDRSKHLSTCVIACDCQLGQKKARTLRVPQFKAGHALFHYDEVMDKAIEHIHEYDSLQDAEWAIARQMLLDFDAQKHTHPDFAAYGPKADRREFPPEPELDF